MHFILLCPMYTNLRCNLIKPYYHINIASNSCLAISYNLCLIITRCSLHKDCCACHKLLKPIRKMRLSSHNFAIEQGRYYNVNRNNRNCKFCIDDMEDEMHFILLFTFVMLNNCNNLKTDGFLQ
jgi:hypothetical protein